ncbi:MAG: hypothetical protein ABSF34_21430 [Verrucomicrobiota bacterium]
MAVLTNDIQKFFLEHSRLGIPVIFHEECLHGHAAIGLQGHDKLDWPTAKQQAHTIESFRRHRHQS